MDTCKTCKHWKTEDNNLTWNEITRPYDSDTYEPMEMPFEVRECKHPQLLFCERPLEKNGFCVADGSQYFAGLYTAEDFGCIRHELI